MSSEQGQFYFRFRGFKRSGVIKNDAWSLPVRALRDLITRDQKLHQTSKTEFVLDLCDHETIQILPDDHQVKRSETVIVRMRPIRKSNKQSITINLEQLNKPKQTPPQIKVVPPARYLCGFCNHFLTRDPVICSNCWTSTCRDCLDISSGKCKQCDHINSMESIQSNPRLPDIIKHYQSHTKPN